MIKYTNQGILGTGNITILFKCLPEKKCVNEANDNNVQRLHKRFSGVFTLICYCFSKQSCDKNVPNTCSKLSMIYIMVFSIYLKDLIS